MFHSWIVSLLFAATGTFANLFIFLFFYFCVCVCVGLVPLVAFSIWSFSFSLKLFYAVPPPFRRKTSRLNGKNVSSIDQQLMTALKTRKRWKKRRRFQWRLLVSRPLFYFIFLFILFFFFWFKLVRHRRWFQRTLQSPTFAKALSVVSLFAEWAAAPSMTAHLPFCTPNWSAVKPLIYADQSASYRPSKKAKKNVTTHANELAVTVGGVGPHVSCKPLSSTLTSCQFPFPVAICIRTHSVNIESK